MKIFKITEHGTNKVLSINSDNVDYFEPLTYNSGESVTIIYFKSGKEIHAKESQSDIEDILNG